MTDIAVVHSITTRGTLKCGGQGGEGVAVTTDCSGVTCQACRSVEPRPRGTNGPTDEGEAVVAHLPKSKYRLIERPTGWDVVATDYSESFT